MSSSDSWMHMDPVGLGKDVLVCSSQRSGIDAVHVSSMKSSMKFEFLAFEAVYLRWQWMIGWESARLFGWLAHRKACGSMCDTVFYLGSIPLRDLDRWLVYSVCSDCLTRWALGYTCSSAVFDFGKGREAPQHARRSLWRFIFRGFLTSKNCERWWANECSLWSVIFRESLTSHGCEVSKWVSRV